MYQTYKVMASRRISARHNRMFANLVCERVLKLQFSGIPRHTLIDVNEAQIKLKHGIHGGIDVKRIDKLQDLAYVLYDRIENVSRNGQVHGVGERIIRCPDGLCAVYFTQPKGGELVSCGSIG